MIHREPQSGTTRAADTRRAGARSGRCFSIAAVALVLLGGRTATAADNLWVGDVSINWAEANWTNALAAGDALFFGTAGLAGATLNNDTAANTQYNGLTFNSGAGAFTIGGNAINLGGGITNNGAGLQTVNLALALLQNTTIHAGAGDLAMGGAIGGAFALLKTGANTLTLSAANTYSGATTVRAGTLTLSANRTATAGAVTVGDTAGSAATLNLQGNLPMGGNSLLVGTAVAGATGIVNHTAGTLGFTANNALLIGNSAGGVVGTYNLNGGSVTSYTSATRGIMLGVNSGAVGNPVVANFNLISGTVSLPGGLLEIGRSDGIAHNTMDSYAQTGGNATVGRLGLGGAAGGSTNVTANFSVRGGTFTATNFPVLAAGASNTATLTVGGTAAVTLPAFPTARGAGSSATLTFDGGTLSPYAASPAYLGGLDHAYLTTNGANLDVAAGKDITVTQALENTPGQEGRLTKLGSGILTLAGASTFSGGTTTSNGYLVVNHNSALGTGTLTLTGAAVRVTVNDGITITNAIRIFNNAGAGSRGLIENSGAGNATLSGPVTITAGAAAGGHFYAAAGGTLTVNGAVTSSIPVALRSGTAVFGGGGSYTQLYATGQVRLGADNGLATNAVMDLGFSGAGVFNLNGYNQTLAGLMRSTANAATVTNGGAAVRTLTLNVAGGTSYAFAGGITGLVALAKDGLGSQTFSNAASTFSGGTTINNGTLYLAAGGGNGTAAGQTSALGPLSSNNTITINNGGVLLAGYNGALGQSGILAEYAPKVIVNQGGRFSTTNTGSGGISFLFNPELNGGTLDAGNGFAGSWSSALGLKGTVKVGGSAASTISTSGTGGNATVSLDSNGVTFDVADATGSAAADLTVSSILENWTTLTGRLSKTGAGTMTLSGANTFSGGTTIDQGTLIASVAGALGAGATTNLAVLNLTAGAVTYTGLSGTAAGTLAGAGTNNVTLGTGTGTTALNGNYSQFTGVWNIGTGAAAGAGKVQMNGLDHAGQAVNVLTHATLYVSTGITKNAPLTLNGGDTGESIGQLRLEAGANWAGPVTLAGNITGTGDFTFGGNSAGTISGDIGESGGARAVTKGGTGTLTFSGANTYSGGTTILGGTLAVGANDTLPTTRALTIGSTGGNTGNLTLNGFNQTVGSLSFKAVSSNTNLVTIAAGNTLTVSSAGTGNAFLAGSFGNGVAGVITQRVRFAGGGALAVNAPAGVFAVEIVGTNAVGATHAGWLDLSGLSAFSATVGNFNVAATGSSGANSPMQMTFALATNTAITATNMLLETAGNSFGTHALSLGRDTTFNANQLVVGGGRQNMTVAFGAMSDPTLVVRGIDGGSTRANLSVGNNAQYAGGSLTAAGLLDLSAGTADLRLGTLNLGYGGNGVNATTRAFATGTLILAGASSTVDVNDAYVGRAANMSATATKYTSAGSLIVSNGTLAVNSALVLGQNEQASGTYHQTASGAFALYGGSAVVSNGIVLGRHTAATPDAASYATGTVTVAGGTLQVTGDLTNGLGNTYGALRLSGGTLDMQGHRIGRAGRPVDAVSLESGALLNLGEFNTGAALVKTTSGTLTLAGANAFTGGVILSNGTLNVNSPTALGATAGAFVIAGPVALDNTSGAPVALANANPQSWNADFAFVGTTNLDLGMGAVTLGGDRQVTVNAGTLTVGGAIGGAGFGVSKAGPGTLRLTGGNTYDGAGTVTEGRLTVDGTQSGLITLNGMTASLGGTGTVVDVTIDDGTLAPGHSVGTLKFVGHLTLSDFATLNYELGAPDPAGGTTGDFVSGVHDLTLAGTLNVTPVGYDFLDAVEGNRWKLIDYSGTPGGTLAVGVVPGLAAGLSYAITTEPTGVFLTVVPEPATVGLLGLAALLALLPRRRRD